MEQPKPNNKLNLDNPIVRLIIALIGLGIFYALYRFYLIPQQTFLFHFTDSLTQLSSWIVSWFGYDTKIFYDSLDNKHYIYLNSVPSVNVHYSCIGFNLIGVFLVILFMFRGKLAPKALYGLLGVILIFLTNAIRIAALAINYDRHPESVDFNHKYTYTIVVYSLIFFLWWMWLEKLSNKKAIADE